MKPNTTTTLLPARVDSAMLAKFLHEGEPVIVLKLVGVGNSAPYDFRDKGTRSYIFRFDSAQEGHLLRVPLHLWQENKARLAHDIMDQRHLAHAMIVTLEMPPSSAAPKIPCTTTFPEQMGATDTSTDTRNVVGPGAEPTVAPSFALRATEGTPAMGGEKASFAVVGPSFAVPATEGKTSGLPDSESEEETGGSAGETTANNGQLPQTTANHPRPLHEAAYDLVEPPKRLKALAAVLGVGEAPLRAAIGDSGSRIELATAGWVRRKA